MSVKESCKSSPLLYYALSICATWAGIGSLMNGVVMTQKLGVIPSLIWVLGNTVACILFGYLVQASGNYNLPLYMIAGMLLISAVLFSFINPEKPIIEN